MMSQEFAPWIALLSVIGGLLVGYFMGYRHGRIAGELAALKSTRSRRDRSRNMYRAHSDSPQPDSYDDDFKDVTCDSRRVPRHAH